MKIPAVKNFNFMKRLAPDSSLGHSNPIPKKLDETDTFNVNELRGDDDDGPTLFGDFWAGNRRAEEIFDASQ